MTKTPNIVGTLATTAMEIVHSAHAGSPYDGIVRADEPPEPGRPSVHVRQEELSQIPDVMALGEDTLALKVEETAHVARFDADGNFLGHIYSTEVKP